MGELPALPRPARRPPKARTEQLSIEEGEEDLLARARVNRPAVSWWHGYRHIGPTYGSYCYVCDAAIATWSALGDIPEAAKKSIHTHKHYHLAGY